MLLTVGFYHAVRPAESFCVVTLDSYELESGTHSSLQILSCALFKTLFIPLEFVEREEEVEVNVFQFGVS